VVKITGDKAYEARLNRMTQVQSPIMRAMYEAGQMIEHFAERSITEGSISGKYHVASLPYEPPNADTHFLDTHIDTTIESNDPPKVHVTSHAPYSVALEYGTSKMKARPFMGPAMRRHRDKFLNTIVMSIKQHNARR
jgi:HK97 gp10 family phage protein